MELSTSKGAAASGDFIAMTFEEMNLMPELMRAVEAMGFAEPTNIQAQAIPLLRSGADVIGRSQTGTGKTMAFAIPAVEMIDRTEAEPTVQVLILCPTRELAQQGADEINIMVGVFNEDFEKAVRVLYNSFAK